MIQNDNTISRQAAKEAVRMVVKDLPTRTEINILINALPSAPERKRGRWVVTSEFEDCRYAKCNQCKVTQVFYYNKPLTNFCPNCGADMREGQNEHNH